MGLKRPLGLKSDAPSFARDRILGGASKGGAGSPDQGGPRRKRVPPYK
jgi:hypothetical protein